jgi:RNA polymerase-binding transcription factor DksA
MADKYEEIVQALNTRLAELTGNVAEIDSELRKPLSARNEEQATDLENQDALEGIEKSKLQEIQQIELALRRIAEGVYGSCSECGAIISAQRLKALPTATRCISCAA